MKLSTSNIFIRIKEKISYLLSYYRFISLENEDLIYPALKFILNMLENVSQIEKFK